MWEGKTEKKGVGVCAPPSTERAPESDRLHGKGVYSKPVPWTRHRMGRHFRDLTPKEREAGRDQETCLGYSESTANVSSCQAHPH